MRGTSIQVCTFFRNKEYRLTGQRLIDSTYSKDPNRPFTHLRRFVKEVFLPEHLKIEINQRGTSSSSTSSDDTENADVPTIFALIQPPLPEMAQLRALLAPFVPTSPPSTTTPTEPSDQSLDKFFLTTTIPIHPPLSAAQADHWSKTLWPTGYNAAFARATIAPPPPLLSATQTDISSKAAGFLRLACEVAREAKQLKRGRGVGVVVVDPAIASSSSSDSTEQEEEDGIVAVAGDARFCALGIDRPIENSSSSSSYNPNCEGGPECHAVMRVVEMIAIQRRSDGISSSTSVSEQHTPELSPLETRYLYQPASTTTEQPTSPTEPTSSATTRILPRSAGGYLCTDLDIYSTHEPCLSCSMGILLSRFRAVTFLRRGRLVTGGLASEPAAAAQPSSETNANRENNYYGLFWRKELNWRAMCFEFVQDEDDTEEQGCEEPGEYHA
jgi:tRNA-specific adenosine deaminase 3